ncbi:hypothetical protein HHK36_012286 [Tetracentron sinense]|uniref:Uncharacterized protein n=1 Tax=Tetracentron sinense TaxID=13715 RepID=A0A834Z893_TETSI|nr:hypothetical protein HHK36_012286 [Tetracentron sinense]
MGNYFSHRSSDTTGKVIFLDGMVHEFDKPLTVAELMLENQQQVVVEFKSLVTGAKVTPLPADKKLDMEKVYLMLPMKRGKVAAFSANEVHQILLRAKSILKSGSLLSSSRILPLLYRICPAAIRAGREHILHRQDSLTNKPEKSNWPDVFDERPEYLSRQFSGKGWKPALDTIKEKGIEKKVPHWLY